MTTPDLAALLKIAEAAERSRGTYPVEMYAVTPFAEAFNPTVAQALVQVAMAAEELYKRAGTNSIRMDEWIAAGDALSALTAALKESNHGCCN